MQEELEGLKSHCNDAAQLTWRSTGNLTQFQGERENIVSNGTSIDKKFTKRL